MRNKLKAMNHPVSLCDRMLYFSARREEKLTADSLYDRVCNLLTFDSAIFYSFL